jgi:hypothetical protein
MTLLSDLMAKGLHFLPVHNDFMAQWRDRGRTVAMIFALGFGIVRFGRGYSTDHVVGLKRCDNVVDGHGGLLAELLQ